MPTLTPFRLFLALSIVVGLVVFSTLIYENRSTELYFQYNGVPMVGVTLETILPTGVENKITDREGKVTLSAKEFSTTGLFRQSLFKGDFPLLHTSLKIEKGSRTTYNFSGNSLVTTVRWPFIPYESRVTHSPFILKNIEQL